MDTTTGKELINYYEDLKSLKGITPQKRGQLFNSFIARVIDAYQHKARANNYGGPGEIDVAFAINGTRYILEAKWENKKINEDPISKIRTRVKQRLAGTVGVVLSMSGFTKNALENMRLGQRLEVLLLTKEHFEALLYGFLTPVDLFESILNNAHFNGEPLAPLKTLAQATIHPDKYDWSKDHNIKFDIQEGFEIEKIVEGGEDLTRYLHYSPQQGLLTKVEDFIVQVDDVKQRFNEVIGIPGIYYYVPINNSYFYALRDYALAKYHYVRWEFIPQITESYSKILVHPSKKVFALINLISKDGYGFKNPSSLINMDEDNIIELQDHIVDMWCTAEGTFIGLKHIYSRDGKNNIVEFTEEGTILKTIEVVAPNPRIHGISMAGEREIYVISSNNIKLLNLDTSEVKIVLTSENSGVLLITKGPNKEAYFSVNHSVEKNVRKGIIFKLKRK